MSYLLEILGRGLLAELGAAFRNLLVDDESRPTSELERRVADDPSDPESQRRLAIRYLGRQEWVRARERFLAALGLDEGDRVSRIGLACALDELGATQSALERLEEVVRDDAEDGPTWFAVGFCQEKLGAVDDAIVSYECALDNTPQLRNAHERLAAIYLKLDNVDMAITHYQHLCWCDPGDLSAGLMLAELYLRADRNEDAIRQFQDVITLEPDNWEAQDKLVATFIEAERYEDAIGALTDLIERRPECADQHLQLGDLYAKVGRQHQALDAYTQAATLNPDYLEATIKIGTARLRGGEFVKAAESFTKAIELNDRIVHAYVGLGVAQQALGHTEDAKISFKVAADVEPNSTLLFSETARLQLQVSAAQQVGRYLTPQAIANAPMGPPDETVSNLVEQQIANVRAALIERPHYSDLHYRLGVLLKHSGDIEGSIHAFKRAVAINPQYLKALTKLGLTLRDAGRGDEAMAVFQRASRIAPDLIDLHYQVGLIFADRNEFSLAMDRFERAAAEEPTNRDYVANLALALQNMGLVDRATATWQALCEVTHQAEPDKPVAVREKPGARGRF
ncbi:MAG: tetratricopeptide repeat protein [Phycisphaerae bacterium]|jgi:tetratricopeptide (TPR) repeat protein